MCLSPSAYFSLTWWISNPVLELGKSFLPLTWKSLTTDVKLGRSPWNVDRSGNLTSEGIKTSNKHSETIVSRSDLPSCFSVAGFDGLAVEAQFPRDRCLSYSVILTLLHARKFSSCKIYHTWKVYFVCWSREFHSRQNFMGCTLVFLQSGLYQHLTLSTLKGQISALAILFQCHLASHSM